MNVINPKPNDTLSDIHTVHRYIEIEKIPEFNSIIGIYNDTDNRLLLGISIFHLKYPNQKPYVIKFNIDWADETRADWLARVLVYDFIELIRKSNSIALSEVRNAYDNFLTKLK